MIAVDRGDFISRANVGEKRTVSWSRVCEKIPRGWKTREWEDEEK